MANGNHIRHERMNYGHIKIYAGNGSLDLAAEVASRIGIPLCERDIITFPNDNIFVRLHSSVRGQDCYAIQTTAAPVQKNLMELLILIRTLHQDSAARITAVIPYLGYSRSDKKDQPRVPITARLVADMIEVAGADRYIVYDLHSKQIQGFFSIPGDVLTAFYILSDYLKSIRPRLQSPVIVASDLGFSKNARSYGMALEAPLAFIEKRRTNDIHTRALTLIGDVQGRDAVIVDDEVDTGGSICEAVQVVKQHGARDVYVAFVHPVLSADAADRLAALPVAEFITTNTIPIPPEKAALFGGRLRILSIAPLLSEVIIRANEGRSVGELFNE
ncbi:MAG TPA: ribose-phosphate diphosphokinase [Anaerolineaceae bacterium]|jgi:ribose-phosphate pyrophosphokinase|nr:ribose-phosphate diphosphokinase [Anaerolineaceae bacterium]HOH21031.1 ribose-phosphate diphosphokinase [Anaerolineaceae bacterium]HOU44906.1 ribose-phosphate diphosphokinase [Anaerolineaceae bacterium]HPA33066.1 ribose-phosphate diphosphokinase [Anaerolineaceae bacterium]HQF46348.1 ribose-phosphate diphosphokinase [Anaerolineaceae bacterium]